MTTFNEVQKELLLRGSLPTKYRMKAGSVILVMMLIAQNNGIIWIEKNT